MGYSRLDNSVLDNIGSLGVTPQQAWLCASILRYQYHPDRLPYPGVDTLAAKLHVHRATVYRWLAALKAKGLVVVKPRYRQDGGRASSEYDLSPLLARCQACDRGASQAPRTTPVAPARREESPERSRQDSVQNWRREHAEARQHQTPAGVSQGLAEVRAACRQIGRLPAAP